MDHESKPMNEIKCFVAKQFADAILQVLIMLLVSKSKDNSTKSETDWSICIILKNKSPHNSFSKDVISHLMSPGVQTVT